MSEVDCISIYIGTHTTIYIYLRNRATIFSGKRLIMCYEELKEWFHHCRPWNQQVSRLRFDQESKIIVVLRTARNFFIETWAQQNIYKIITVETNTFRKLLYFWCRSSSGKSVSDIQNARSEISEERARLAFFKFIGRRKWTEDRHFYVNWVWISY
jgi:hypothetical protein